MKYVITILVCLLVAAFFGNYPVLIWIYPDTDQWSGFVPFYNTRNTVYAAMFTLFLFVIMTLTKGFNHAVSKFGFIAAFGSFFDLAFLGINWYLRSDILLLMIAFEISITQYLIYEPKNRRRNKIFFS